MLQSAASKDPFSLAQARNIVKDLFAPNPLIYWADFLASLVGGAIAFGLVRHWAPNFSIEQAVLFVISGVLYYRAALFIHETIHLRENTFKAFRFVWNLFCGIPFLMPSYMYYTHVDHHMRKHFGTDHDGEYLALATTRPIHILLYVCQAFVIPILALLRFLVFTPISWFSPTFRAFVHKRASSLVMDPSYIRPLPTRKAVRIFRIQEAACFLWIVGFAYFAVKLRGGYNASAFLVQAYLTSVLILLLNHVRTLGAHRYTNPGGEMTFVDQLLDSVNYPNWSPLTLMWAPVGLRYHALHHLFPSLPYHNLGKAHQRLMAELPADSPYRLTESTSLWASIRQLWRHAHAATAGGGAVAVGRGGFEARVASSAHSLLHGEMRESSAI